MLVSTLPPRSDFNDSLVGGLAGSFEQIISRAAMAFESLAEGSRAGAEFKEAITHAAEAIAQLPRASGPGAQSAIAARQLVKQICLAPLPYGFIDDLRPLEGGSGSLKHWPSLLAVMLTCRAYESPQAPNFEDVPDALWGDYSAWLFAPFRGSDGHAEIDAFAQHFERRAVELAHWVARNPGSAAVQAAWQSYVASSARPVLRVSSSGLKSAGEAHARMTARVGRFPAVERFPAQARDGRKLRVGFVAPAMDESAQGLAALPLCSHLDRQRFEVEIFVMRASSGMVEQMAREAASVFHTLPESTADRLELLRGAQLDCAVFLGDTADLANELLPLALHRFAPLQVVTSAHCEVTSGSEAIDLFVTGEDVFSTDLIEQFSERVGLIHGPARTFDLATVPDADEAAVSREMLGLPREGTVFVAVGPLERVTLEVRRLWTRILHECPGSHLLIVPDETSAVSATELDGAFAASFSECGVDAGRVLIYGGDYPSFWEAVAMLRVGDIYLHLPGTRDDLTLFAALQCGLPAIAAPGTTLRSRRGAAILRSLDQEELIAAHDDGYVALATDLAFNAQRRAEFLEQLKSATGSLPRTADALATGDAFGAMLEHAFNEMARTGAKKFRLGRLPLRVSLDVEKTLGRAFAAEQCGDHTAALEQARAVLGVDSPNPKARAIAGRALFAMGQASAAVEYLLAAAESRESDRLLWFTLARALEADQRVPQALQALETGLRLTPDYADGWLMLVDLAERAGASDIAREAFAEFKAQCPTHPAVLELAGRLAS